MECDHYPRLGSISRRNEKPLNSILEVEVFDVVGINLMRLFPLHSTTNIVFLAVDYASWWVEAIPTTTCDAKVVLNFLQKYIFARFEIPRAIIRNEGTYFCNNLFDCLLAKYGVRHRTTLAYYPQSNGQARIYNREINFFL